MIESGTGGTRSLCKTIYLPAIAVVLACVLAYALALNGPLFFDDVPNLTENPRVQIDGMVFDDWRVAALSSHTRNSIRPVAMLTFAVNHAVEGAFSPLGLKAVNLAVHLTIGALLYFFAQAVLSTPALRPHGLTAFDRSAVALIAVSLWLLHPIHVSTVLYAVQRMAQLSALFTLAGLLVFIRYRQRWAQEGARTGELIAAFLWLVLLGLFAVLSKENGALLPWLVAVTEVTLFRGLWRGQTNVSLQRFGYLLILLPLVLIIGVASLAPELLPGSYAGREFTLQERLLTQSRALWQYLSWLLLPNVLDMGFFHDDIPLSRGLMSPFTTGLSILAWLTVIFGCLLGHRRYPLAAFALLFYLVAHSLESSVLPLEMVFEHRNYLPSIGLAILVAVGIVRGAARVQGLRLRALVGAVLVVLLALLVVRTNAWRDELTLAEFEVINHPQSARANFQYANALFKRLKQSQTLGLDEQEKMALAVTSRRHFERMHTINEREFAALVALYQLDTQFFPGLAEQNDWLGTMEELARTRRLQSSDRTALAALGKYSLTPPGAAGRDRVANMLDQLGERFPKNIDIFGIRYELAAGGGAEGKAAFHADLLRMAQLNPQSQQAAAYVAEYHGTDDLGATYQALLDWMQRDPYRRELPVIRGIFDN
jgi:protein O-mannosyl-transferase